MTFILSSLPFHAAQVIKGFVCDTILTEVLCKVLPPFYQPLYAFFPLWLLLTYECAVLPDPDVEYRSGRVAGHLTRNLHLVAGQQKQCRSYNREHGQFVLLRYDKCSP
jgi:hypothetical protein